MKIKAKLIIEVISEYDDDNENNAETLRFCVEQDLEDMGYQVDYCEVIEGTEEIEFSNNTSDF